MSKDPDEVFGPGDELPTGPVIDVTPGKKKGRGAIDFDSDKPVLEQMLEEHKLDRSDKKPGCLGKAVMLVCLTGLLTYFLVCLVTGVFYGF